MEAELITEGRDLDERIAIEVMGWPVLRYIPERPFLGVRANYPHLYRIGDALLLWTWESNEVLAWTPTTDIRCAWMVVRHLQKERGLAFSIWGVPIYSSVMNRYVVAFARSVYPPEFTPRVAEGTYRASGEPLDESPALAICRAALLALEAEKTK